MVRHDWAGLVLSGSVAKCRRKCECGIGMRCGGGADAGQSAINHLGISGCKHGFDRGLIAYDKSQCERSSSPVDCSSKRTALLAAAASRRCRGCRRAAAFSVSVAQRPCPARSVLVARGDRPFRPLEQATRETRGTLARAIPSRGRTSSARQTARPTILTSSAIDRSPTRDARLDTSSAHL